MAQAAPPSFSSASSASRPPTADVWAAWAASLDAAERTRDTYAKALRRWRSWLDGAGVEWFQASRADVVSYRQELLAGGAKPATVNAYLSALRSFYRWTEAQGLCPNVAADVRGVKTGRSSAKDALTVEQARSFAAEGGGERTVKALRDRAMAVLMVSRGLRTVEVARADVGDIRQVGGVAVLMVQGKGYADKGDFVVLAPEVLGPIREYLAARGRAADDEPLFASLSRNNAGGRMTTRSVSRICKERMRAMGIDSPRLTAHSLRHTAVTLALLGGASVQEVQQMARHANIQTTMVYAHNIERMAGAAERSVDRALFS